MNSHPDLSAADPNVTRRMFSLTSSTGADMQRRLRLIIDQCETVRFPFKKRLILANLSLSHDDIPVQDICSERLGTALYKLSLAGNEILSIPEPLVLKLTGLRVLDVSQCGLQSLPDRWDLPSLRKLVVSHNRIQTFPSESVFQGLPELQHLEFYRNKMAIIPPLSDPVFLAKLEYLDMGDNQLVAIPVELARLPALKTLKFVHNLIEIIPAEICEMDLRVLDVSSNPLMQPPLETCQRGIQSMRRYYHCLKLEEMVGQDLAQSPPNESMFKKKVNERRLSMKKIKDSTKKALPSALTRSSMFRTSSDHAKSGNSSSLTASMPSTLKSELSSVGHEEKMPLFVHQHHVNAPPTRSVSLFDARECPPQSNGSSFNYEENIADKITVNDTLKVIFVGMALSGKTIRLSDLRMKL